MNDIHDILLSCSFSGIELATEHAANMTAGNITAISKATASRFQALKSPVRIISEVGTEQFAESLAHALNDSACSASLTTWEPDITEKNPIHIIVDNVRNPLLTLPSKERFRQLAKLVGGRSNILWITVHEEASAALKPERGLVVGFARSARTENTDLKFITFDVQDSLKTCLPELHRTVQSILWTSLGTPTQLDQLGEFEYAYRDGQVLIPRLIPDNQITIWMERVEGKHTTELMPYGQGRKALRFNLPKLASDDEFYFDVNNSISVALKRLM